MPRPREEVCVVTLVLMFAFSLMKDTVAPPPQISCGVGVWGCVFMTVNEFLSNFLLNNF